MTWTTPIDPPADGNAITRAFYMTYVKDNFAHLRVVTGGDPAGAGLLLVSSGAGVGSWSGSPSITALTLSGALTAATGAFSGAVSTGALTVDGTLQVADNRRLLIGETGTAAAPSLAWNSAEGAGQDGFFEAASHELNIAIGQNSIQKWGSTFTAILVNGTYAGTWTSSSDRSLKDDVQPVRGALASIVALKPITYLQSERYEELYGHRDDRRRHGFIAQDVLDVLPDLVEENGSDGILSIDYTRLTVPILAGMLEYISRTDARIEALEAAQ